jgi:hypothetical protein
MAKARKSKTLDQQIADLQARKAKQTERLQLRQQITDAKAKLRKLSGR